MRPNLKLVVTGGVVRSKLYELSGPLTEASLATLNLDVVFVGVDGIEVRAGCTTHHDIEAHSNGAMIDRAHQVIVVADSSKIGHVAFAQICPVDAVTVVISDIGADSLAVKALQDAGPQVDLV